MNKKFNKITFVLRGEQDAKINSKYLNDKGVYAKPFPITTTNYSDFSKSKLLRHHFDYFIITSSKAIQSLDEIVLYKNFNKKKIKIYSIGQETEEKLKTNGYKNILNANNNSVFLYELILTNTLVSDLGLWVAAKDRSLDLKEKLFLKNRKIEVFEAYQTCPRYIISKSIYEDLIKFNKINLIIFSSRNVSLSKDILKHVDLFNDVNNKSTLFVNSENVAKKAKDIGWINIQTIKKNFTKDILDYILETYK